MYFLQPQFRRIRSPIKMYLFDVPIMVTTTYTERENKMAHVTDIFCTRCNKLKQVVRTAENQSLTICGQCQQELSDMKKEDALKMLTKLTVEERLKRVEEFIYMHSQNHPKPLAKY